MAVIETWLRQDLKGLVTVRSLQGQVFSLDNGGNLIGVKVTKDYKPVTLTGTVTGYCILSDGQTVTVTGSGNAGIQNGNEAYIVLPQLVYSVPGQISIVIKLTSGSVTTTLAACTGYVYRSRTSNEVVPPGTPIPDLATMEEVIRRATEAITRATEAATDAEKVNAAMTKEGDVITIAVTDRDGNVTEKTVTDQSNAVAELGKAVIAQGIYIETESQPIVSISDGADDQPMKSVKVAIEPVQDLHGYDSPWPAGGGKNLIPIPYSSQAGTYNGITVTVNDDGTLILNGTASNTVYFNLVPNSAGILLTAGDYILHKPVPTAISGLNITVVKNGGYWNSSTTVDAMLNLTESANISFYIQVSSGTVLSNVKVYPMFEKGTTVSEWTPYSNICPITGWTGANVARCGKNLLDLSILRTGSFDDTSNQSNVSFDELLPIKGGLQYVWSTALSNISGRYIRFYDATKTVMDTRTTLYAAGAKTFTAPENACYFRAMWYIRAGLHPDDITKDQIELGSTATEYEPYQGQTYEVTFPADPGTVYGGTLDVVSGKLVVDRVKKQMTYEWINSRDSNAIGVNSAAFVFGGSPAVWVRNWNYAEMSERRSGGIKAICNAFKVSVHDTYAFSSQYRIYFKTDTADVDAFKASVQALEQNGDGLWLCYELATPQEITLTQTEIKTLLGVNNVWSDAGNTAITYLADTKTYIDNRINSTRKLIAGIETGFVASKAYSVGDMLIIGDDLYKVASAIASGATITVGTNVTKTTVAEQLIALANA